MTSVLKFHPKNESVVSKNDIPDSVRWRLLSRVARSDAPLSQSWGIIVLEYWV
jgi:hypothetical protein